MPLIDPRDRLIVALDVPDVASAEHVIDTLGGEVSFYKVGMELAYGGGFGLMHLLVGRGKKVFLDLKIHDIPNTVQRAVAQVAGLGATFLTVHAYPQTMDAAVAGAAGTGLHILAVTVLTSSDDDDLARAGYAFGVADLVQRRGAQAKACGVSGLVASPGEAAALRASLGNDIYLVAPGIRPGGVTSDDQKRIATPTQAIRNGADYLVVGRPIVQATDPRAAATAIIREIDRAAAA